MDFSKYPKKSSQPGQVASGVSTGGMDFSKYPKKGKIDKFENVLQKALKVSGSELMAQPEKGSFLSLIDI